LTINGWAFNSDHYKEQGDIAILLMSQSDTLMILGKPTERSDVRSHFKNGFPGLKLETGFQVSCSTEKFGFKATDYSIAIAWVQNAEVRTIKNTGKRIRIDPKKP
jgi:hypothetical protein